MMTTCHRCVDVVPLIRLTFLDLQVMDGISKPLMQHLTRLKRWDMLGKCAEVEGLNELKLDSMEVNDADAAALGDVLALPNIALTKLRCFAASPCCGVCSAALLLCNPLP